MFKLNRDERGMASILVASIVMIIMSLITLGFARIMSREQRQSLDRQLSTQAFYAAESAVNDARAAIADGATATKDTCDVITDSPYVRSDDGILDLNGDIRYTCLLVSTVVTSLEYDNGVVNDSVPRVSRLEAQNPAAIIDTINIAWEGANPGMTAFGGCGGNNPRFTPTTLWGNNRPALLRVDIMPLTALNRTALNSSTRSLYLYPGVGCSTGVSYGALAPHGDNRFSVGCAAANTPRHCRFEVNGLAGLGTSRFYVRLSTFYKAANVSLSAEVASGSVISLQNGQASIDATGRSNDVIRRIRVRVPIFDDTGRTNAGISSTDSICKNFGLTEDGSGNVIIDPESLDPPCT